MHLLRCRYHLTHAFALFLLVGHGQFAGVHAQGRWADVSSSLLTTLTNNGAQLPWPGGVSGVVVNRTNGAITMKIVGLGLWRSSDKGQSWTRIDDKTISGRDETGWATSLDQNAPSRLASFSLDGSAGWTIDGMHWQTFTTLGRNWDYGSIDWSSAKPQTIIAAKHETTPPGEVYLSENGGASWTQLSLHLNENRGHVSMVGALGPKTLVYSNGDGIQRTTDSGHSWTRVSPVNPQTRIPVVFQGAQYLGGTNGLIVSRDLGLTWRSQGAPVNIWQGPFFGRTEKEIAVIGGEGAFITGDGGESWKRVAPLKPKETGFLFTPNWFGCYAWDPVNKAIYASAMGNALYRLDLADQTKSSPPVNYARPFEPPTHAALLPLPPGAVEPAGWLRDWCLAARDGYTGHMDEYGDEFKHAWAPDYQMKGDRLLWSKGAWPYEGGGYWFDGLARLGFALHDDGLMAQATRRLGAVADHMNTNGLLFLWWLDRNNPADRQAVKAALEGWPLWASGLLGRAMSGYYAGSGNPQILAAMVQAYGSDPDCLRTITANMSNPWPAYDTFCWTGNQGIAQALDRMFTQEGGALLPSLNRYRNPPNLRPGTTVDNAHVVEFIETTTPWAVGYLWTGDARYLEAAVGWHDLLERVAMQPYGVPVSDEWYGPTGAFRGSETCDVAGYVWSQVSLLQVTGEGRMGDRLERAFFNAGPATVSRDFKTHVYFQSPNRFANLSPNFPHGPMAHGGTYQRTHSPLCCTAALNRIVPWYVTHMWMATYDNGLSATCYGPCKVSALVADRVPVVITSQTDYPFSETIALNVEPEKTAGFPLEFRIPGWCTSPSISVNGSPVKVERSAKGFARIHREWNPGDKIHLHFPMTAVVERGRDAASGPPYDGAHRVTRVTVPEPDSTRGRPYASVSYGPLLFALPIADTTDANTPDPLARWRFALDVQNPGFKVERGAMPPRWDWPLAAPLKLRANAVEIAWKPDPKDPHLPALPVATANGSESVTLVPYGCTKFRISMLPVTAEPEVKPVAIRRILFLGNSITLHGPKPDIGWTNNWGMAASAEEKDYVHLVAHAIAQQTGVQPQIRVKNIADFERNFSTYDVDGELKDLFAFDPDLVVLAIGENVPALDSDGAQAKFKAGVGSILRCVLAKRHPLVVVRSSFWPDATKDQLLKEACEEASARFVDAGSIGRDPANAARSERSFTHDGVAGHPGDRGMKALAEAIVQAVLE